jgi:hypothetical protein
MNGTCQLQKLITFETYVRFLYNMIMITGPLKGKSNYHNSKLHHEPPLINLFSIGPILTLILQTGIQAAAQIFVYLHIQEQPWYDL